MLLIEQSISDLKDQSLIHKIQQNIFNIQREQKSRGQFNKSSQIEKLLSEIDDLKNDNEKLRIQMHQFKEDNQDLQSELLKASQMLKKHN